MLSRFLCCLPAATIAACVAGPPLPAEPPAGEDLAAADADLPVAVVDPETVDRIPDVCESLLSSLDRTRPLLENLDASLSGQAARLEDALRRLEAPESREPPPECIASRSNQLGNKEVIGAIEWVYMQPPGRHYRARVDSGAETSSLSASDIVEYERDGDEWVRFNFQHDNGGDVVEFELPVKRTVLVRQSSSGEPERRVVIELDIHLGDQLQTTEFALTDRSRMSYPVLLGRAFLMDLYVVDVSRSYTHDRYQASD